MNVGFNSHPSLTDMEPLWPKNNHPILRKIDLLIRSNVSNELFDANNLSKQVGISVSSLNRFLKSEVNASAGTLIKNFRLEVAYQMITETDIPIKSIGINIGFVQPSNFTRAFIRKYKKRPSQLRLDSTQKKISINWSSPLSEEERLYFLRFLSKNTRISNGIYSFCSQIENLDNTLAEFSNSCCLSPSQLNRILRKNLNTSASVLLRYLRISYVLYYLIETDKNISDLIYSANFCDTSYFYKCFKSIYKVTPKTYLKVISNSSDHLLYPRILHMHKSDKWMRL